MKNKSTIAIYGNLDFIDTIKRHVFNSYNIIEKLKLESLQQEIRVNTIVCIIIQLEKNFFEGINIEVFKKKFSHIPCVVVVSSYDMELARYCGSIGIESVLPYQQITYIDNELERVCAEKYNGVSLKNLSIDKEKSVYTAIVREALSIIDRGYLKIFNIREIADLLEINESTLSREFSKAGLPGPKKILMYLKVQYATKLMKNKGLNIREISSLSGFTDEKRMAECFHRMFGMPPGEYRIKNIL